MSRLSADQAQSDYAIVIEKSVHADEAWRSVCDALIKRHPGAEVVTWQGDVSGALAVLSPMHPKYTCFVAPCTKVGPGFVAEVHRVTRRYDADDYTDTCWGILTGYDAADALELARFEDAIEVKRVSSGTEFAMEMVEEGVWYDELVANKTVSKQGGAAVATEGECPTDTTRLLADTLTDWRADLFITSGHGFKRGWQIGFRYRNGHFESEDGRMYGRDLAKERFEIRSDHPRVYLPIGNCLIGCIEDKDAFAIAMMRSLGVKGMIGYTVPTWFGYSGWGCLDTFVEQPGRYTLNQAFLANQHALIHRLSVSFPGLSQETPEPGKTVRSKVKLTGKGAEMGVKSGDAAGLLHDRDVVAYYGDPALNARMKERECAYQQTLEKDGENYTLTVKGNRGSKSFQTVNRNGSQRGGRPVVVFLDERIGVAELLEGDEWSPVITDDFVLVPNPGEGEEMVIRFRAGLLK